MRTSFYLAKQATTPGQLDAQLPPLLTKLYGLGQRVLVRCPDQSRVARISDLLWKTPAEGFLPHAIASDGLPPEKQPLFLTAEKGNPSNATTLLRIGGSDEDTQGFTEVIEFFSGLEADKEFARKRWRLVKAQGGACRFFAQEEGRWQLAQEQ